MVELVVGTHRVLVASTRLSQSRSGGDGMDYRTIKEYARQTGQRVTDLIALAPQNDPFYMGTPNDWTIAEWFAGLWRVFGYAAGVHLRRIHYQIVSQNPPVLLPNGLPYENTVEGWDFLNMASKAARYLQLVNPAAFVDRKNAEAMIYAGNRASDPQVYLGGSISKYDFAFPEFPDLPGYRVSGYTGEQAYYLELWCEKSTMNDILLPLCQRYGANLQIGSGELSITSALSLVTRLQDVGKPARIFYVSDFDPAGQSMPVAIARKVEFFIRTLELDLDVRVFPVVLTAEQVRSFGLPRTPIKETERRRAGFEERYGEGAVELDALESLYPGQLAALLSQCLECYYDTSLEERVEEARMTLQGALDSVGDGVVASFEPDIEALRLEYETLKREFVARMEGYGQRLQSTWQAMREDLRWHMPSLEEYPVPQAVLSDELGDGLYNSRRDYLDQVWAYKDFQGKLAEQA